MQVPKILSNMLQLSDSMLSEREIARFVSGLGSQRKELLHSILAVYRAGNAIGKRSKQLSAAATAADEVAGFHGGASEADRFSQRIIFTTLNATFPNMYFIGEEKKAGKLDDRLRERILTGAKFEGPIKNSLVGIADPLDGTSNYDTETGRWAVSLGITDSMEHMVSAIYAPRCNFRESGEGLLAFAAADTGTFYWFDGQFRQGNVAAPEDSRKAIVEHGVDVGWLGKKCLDVYRDLSLSTRTCQSSAHTAYSLARIAAGDLPMLWQPRQGVYDWAGGKLLVERAGGAFEMFEFDERQLGPGSYDLSNFRRIERLEPRHYNPDQRVCGFTAGEKTYVKRWTERVVANL